MATHNAIRAFEYTNVDVQPKAEHQRIADVIEEICQAGCKVVLEKISAIEAGRVVPELSDLPKQGERQVLKELKSIMAVYGDVCRL